MLGLALFGRCRSLRAATVISAAVFGAWGPLTGASAAALPAGCGQSGQTVICTYTSGSNPFTVPAGVSLIHTMAVGGSGGSPAGVGTGGHGAVVAGNIPTTPGETVYAVVGTNGGLRGFSDGGDGGGASDVRTSQNELSSRLLVAAGGGGGGGFGVAFLAPDVFSSSPGGRGGLGGGQDGESPPGLAPGGGRGGSSTAGGAGGAGQSSCLTFPLPPPVCGAGTDGGAGSSGGGGVGGTGASFGSPATLEFVGGNGGGGGGGLFGGGGGGGGQFSQGGGGGGGGSNLVPSGGSAAVDTSGVPEVVISYAIDPTSSSVRCTPSPVVAGRSATCSATVTDTATSDASTPTGLVSFSTGGQGSFGSGGQCTLASVGGAASCSVSYTPSSTESNPSRTDTITASYEGDGGHSPSQATTQLSVISPTPLARGTFVIGDENAAPRTAVTFWGAQWSTLNRLTGGPAPASFKGFASQTPNNPPQCGDRWTSGPGGSSSPPASVPQYTEAIVANRVSKQGSTISGDTEHVVVVRTNPGHGPEPDQPGTGTVIAQAC